MGATEKRWTIHACPCGATADGTMPYRMIHRGNCVFEPFKTVAIEVEPASNPSSEGQSPSADAPGTGGSPNPERLSVRLREAEAREEELRAEVGCLREEMQYHVPQDGYCPACGCYMPHSLDGKQRVHGCDRTPPLGHMRPTVYACPTCGGHAPFAAGCWGTLERPHEHVFMRAVHLLVADLRVAKGSSPESRPGLDGRE